jgi:RNA polymerase sigma factor (sigma-70 family)
VETAFLPNATLAQLYRFAWLLSGEAKAAEAILGAALEGLEPQLEQIRSAASRNQWLVRRIRQTCLKHTASTPPTGERAPRLLREESLEPLEILEIEAYIVAQRFHALPEPDRSALALFYLDLLTPAETAKLLDFTLEQVCEILGRARLKLHEAMRTLQAGAPQPA